MSRVASSFQHKEPGSLTTSAPWWSCGCQTEMNAPAGSTNTAIPPAPRASKGSLTTSPPPAPRLAPLRRPRLAVVGAHVRRPPRRLPLGLRRAEARDVLARALEHAVAARLLDRPALRRLPPEQ